MKKMYEINTLFFAVRRMFFQQIFYHINISSSNVSDCRIEIRNLPT